MPPYLQIVGLKFDTRSVRTFHIDSAGVEVEKLRALVYDVHIESEPVSFIVIGRARNKVYWVKGGSAEIVDVVALTGRGVTQIRQTGEH